MAQFASVPDAAANRLRAVELLKAAGGAGAELVVLPEAAMYPFDRPRPELTRSAEALDGPFVGELAGAAAELGLTVIAGMFEKVAGSQQRSTTRSSPSMQRVSSVGTASFTSTTPSARGSPTTSCRATSTGTSFWPLGLGDFVVGVVTCYDLRFPEIFRALVDKGVTVLAVPAAWVAGPLKLEHWVTLCRARAIENTSYLLAAAQPPPTYCGHSLVLDPMGVELAGLGDGEGVAVAEISSERLVSVRAALPVLTQRRYEVRPRP